jgi:hypothetical protein
MKVRIYFQCWFMHRDRAYLIALHARSQLFMAMLTGKSCQALVAQALPY